MKRIATLFSAILFVVLFFRSTEAHALGPINVEVGPRLGYATNPNTDQATPLGIGIGGRAGLEFLHGVYAGVGAMYYLGSSQDTTLGVNQVSTHSVLFGLEAGYGLHLRSLTIRPQLGIGEATITGFKQFDASTGFVSINDLQVTKNHLYLEPGVVALINLGLVYVGADANILVITDANAQDGNAYTSFAFGLQAGLRF
ncbi:MAG: hypothetical protein ABI461_24060 [Polyangiaceae bacterium]